MDNPRLVKSYISLEYKCHLDYTCIAGLPQILLCTWSVCYLEFHARLSLQSPNTNQGSLFFQESSQKSIAAGLMLTSMEKWEERGCQTLRLKTYLHSGKKRRYYGIPWVQHLAFLKAVYSVSNIFRKTNKEDWPGVQKSKSEEIRYHFYCPKLCWTFWFIYACTDLMVSIKDVDCISQLRLNYTTIIKDILYPQTLVSYKKRVFFLVHFTCQS